MQTLIFKPLAKSSPNAFISTLNFLVALCSGGTAAHEEITFIANDDCVQFFKYNQVLYNGKPLEIILNEKYSVCMSKKGFVVQTWDKRFEQLKKAKYKGVIKRYKLHDANLLALCNDIKRCIDNKLSYGLLEAYYSSIHHTVLGKIFRWFGIEKGADEFCSSVSTFQRIRVSKVFRDYVWAKEGISKDTNQIIRQESEKNFARKQTPNDSETLLEFLKFEQDTPINLM